jgi:predicted TIM-barrel fold metal-dependent hydrolase
MMLINPRLFAYYLLILLCPASLTAQPLFDTHLHYNAEHTQNISPQQVIQTLERNNIQRALVTGRPARLAMTLYKAAPQRIVPILGVYENLEDKNRWHANVELPARVARQLRQGKWRGIGELHLFADDRHSPVFERLVELATQHQLPLLLHADPAVIDRVYEINPQQTVIWAHAGTFPYPALIADYLSRYPKLYVDVSVRDERIAPGGDIDDDWYELFLRHPDRFLIGVDTFSSSRWQAFDRAVTGIRRWLQQLPPEIRSRLAFDNAARLFGRDALGAP